jgi:hypothetical protein
MKALGCGRSFAGFTSHAVPWGLAPWVAFKQAKERFFTTQVAPSPDFIDAVILTEDKDVNIQPSINKTHHFRKKQTRREIFP